MTSDSGSKRRRPCADAIKAHDAARKHKCLKCDDIGILKLMVKHLPKKKLTSQEMKDLWAIPCDTEHKLQEIFLKCSPFPNVGVVPLILDYVLSRTSTIEEMIAKEERAVTSPFSAFTQWVGDSATFTTFLLDVGPELMETHFYCPLFREYDLRVRGTAAQENNNGSKGSVLNRAAKLWKNFRKLEKQRMSLELASLDMCYDKYQLKAGPSQMKELALWCGFVSTFAEKVRTYFVNILVEYEARKQKCTEPRCCIHPFTDIGNWIYNERPQWIA